MTNSKRAVIPPTMASLQTRLQYSPGVRAGGLLFVSGQAGRDLATGEIAVEPERQYTVAFENVKTVLEAGGATLADVVELVTYHTTFDDFAVFMDVKGRYLGEEPFPAWTALGVERLVVPGLLVEIKCIAQLA